MSETETDPNPFAAVTWPESYQDAPESADNGKPAVTTIAEPTPAENGVSCTAGPYWEGYSQAQSYRAAVPKPTGAETTVPIDPPATGTEAAVCADIARRQRRGIAKYGKTVIGNLLSFHQWLTHFYEELLDAAVYAKRIIHDHENQTQNHGGASGVLPNNSGAVRIPRKPGGGRKPLVCPNCGGVKTIGSSMKDGIPIKRCKVCGHVHKRYPHLANGKAPAEMA